MGLNIVIQAGYEGPREECRSAIRSFLKKSPPLLNGRRINFSEDKDTLWAELFFAEEEVCFEFQGQSLLISGKTSNGGPGYHAYLTRLLKSMKEPCGLDWDDDAVEDDSGFWQNNSFESLQESMATWLDGLAEMLLENFQDNEEANLGICMSREMLPEASGHFASHPLGWLDLNFFRYLTKEGVTPRDCEHFFIWWDEEKTPGFYLNCAMSMIWCCCNWLPPHTEEEKSLYSSIFLCLEQAWDEDPSLPFPVPEWKELAALAESDELIAELDRRFPGIGPDQAYIGYRRGDMVYSLEGGWRITLPGRVHIGLEEGESRFQVFWDGVRAVRASCLQTQKQGFSARVFLADLTRDSDFTSFPMPQGSAVQARAMHETKDDGSPYAHVMTFYGATEHGAIILVSLHYSHPADKAWAEAAAGSIAWGKED